MIFSNPCICQCQKQNIRTELIVLTHKPSIRKIHPDFKGPTVALIPKHMQIKSHYMNMNSDMNRQLNHAQTAQNLFFQDQSLISRISYSPKQRPLLEESQKQNILYINQDKQTKRQTLKKPINPMQSSVDLIKTKRRRNSYYPELTMKLLQRQNTVLRKQYQELKKEEKELLNYKQKCKIHFQGQKDKFVKNRQSLQKQCKKRHREIEDIRELLLICKGSKSS